ncbi:hypothetical protein OB999_18900 [Bacillus cereus]|nr:hypothetical protein [Bacillus cereus]
MFYYHIYGLNIASKIELPVGIEGTQESVQVPKMKIDLYFEIDDKFIQSPSTEMFNDYVKAEAGKYKYVNCLTGEYEINAEGTYVSLSRFTNCKSLKDAGACFIGVIFPYILQIKEMVPIHASGVATETGVWGIMAGPGVGKSTTQISLLKKNMKFFTDDVIPLVIKESVVLAYPGYPALKLSENSLKFANEEQFTSISLLTENSTKYVCSLYKDNVCKDPLMLKGLFLLKPNQDKTKGIEISKLTGYEKLINLMANVFTLSIMNNNSNTQYLDVFSSNVFNNIPVYSINYPKEFSYLDNVTDKIIEIIKWGHMEGEKVV